MSFLFKWLRPQTSARIGLRPHRTVEVALPIERAYEQAKSIAVTTLGAHLANDDSRAYAFEVSFGLVNSERIRVACDPIDETTTRVRIEAIFRAGAVVPERSLSLSVLADTLEAGIAS